jgi:hypothetical protein
MTTNDLKRCKMYVTSIATNDYPYQEGFGTYYYLLGQKHHPELPSSLGLTNIKWISNIGGKSILTNHQADFENINSFATIG